jgi:hypothetical protein
VNHFLRLLLPDDRHVLEYVRTPDEFYEVFSLTSPNYSHYVLVGHASSSGLHFALNRTVTATQLRTQMTQRTTGSHCFLALCCHSGEAQFAKTMSEAAFCKDFVGAFGALHGAAASQFVHSLFSHHLLTGSSFRVAYKAATESLVSQCKFRHWRNGTIQSA